MPIELYTGLQGAGKTYSMVKEAILPALADPRWIVLSNLHVTHPKTKQRTINVTDATGRRVDFEFITNLIDRNLEAPDRLRRNVLLAVDEIGMAMPQEMWKGDAIIHVLSIVLQLRKARVDFVGTVQHFDRAVKVLRDNTNVIHECSVFKRTWLWWHRDENGALNRRTGKPYKMVWLFEVESMPPNAVHLARHSDSRARARIGWRKVRFDPVTAAAYDTYQRQAASADIAGPAGPSDVDDIETVARKVIDLRVSSGELLTAQESGKRPTRPRRT